MKRWYFAASVILALASPAAIMAQATGGNATGTGAATGGGMGGNARVAGNLAGTVNTTLLGNTVDLKFNSVFGNQATLANTVADNFAAYRPTGSGTGASTGGTGTSFGGGGGGGATGGGALGGGALGTNTNRTGAAGGLGANTANRGGTGLGGTLGGAGGGIGGGLGGGIGGIGGNRTATMGGMGGGNIGGFGGQNRGGFLGGGGFLGTGAGNFLGGGANNQQTTPATIGYQVHYQGSEVFSRPSATITSNVDYQQRLVGAPGMQGAQNLQVFTRGQTAILRGQVGSDYAKQLAAAMIRLEPGVYEVENELVVVAPKQ